MPFLFFDGFIELFPASVDHIHEVAVMQLSRSSSGGIELHIVVEPLGEKIHYPDGIEAVQLQDILDCGSGGTSGQVLRGWYSFLILSRELSRVEPMTSVDASMTAIMTSSLHMLKGDERFMAISSSSRLEL